MGLRNLTTLRKTQTVAWVPSDEASLNVWIDGTDSTGTYIVKDGSNKVSSAVSRSAGAYTFDQATGSKQPTWTSGARNGRGALAWTAASAQTLKHSGGTTFIENGSAWTLAGVVQCATVDPTLRGLLALKHDLGGSFANYHVGVTTNGGYANFYFGSGTSPGSNFATLRAALDEPTDWFYWVLRYNGSGSTTPANYSLRVGGAALSTETASGLGSAASTSSSIAWDENAYQDGYTMHLLHFESQLTGASLTNLEAWLAAEMG
jgi:hypothetical protein